MCVCVLCMCTQVLMPRDPEKVVAHPGAGGTDNCKLPDVGVGN